MTKQTSPKTAKSSRTNPPKTKRQKLLPYGQWTKIARKFVQQVGHVWFWRGEPYMWTDQQWQKLTTEEMRSVLYKWLERKYTTHPDGEVTRFNPDTHKVKEIYEALAGIRSLPGHKDAPFWTTQKNGDPDPVDLLPFKNGVLNLRTGRLRKPDKRLFSIHRVEAAYDTKAGAPEWEKFLHSMFPDDPVSRETIEEMIGYSMTMDRSQQKIFMMIGPPRCGKGTIGRVLTQLVGPARYAGPTVASFGSEFGMWQLIGKTVATIADARSGRGHDPYLVVERLLTISGQDHVSINRKYLPFYEGTLQTQIWWMSNELPKWADASGAIATRLVLIKFSKSFLGCEDPLLTKKLLAELSGIANKALAGYKRLCKRGGFQQPEAGRAALHDISVGAHPVRAWLEEFCEITPEAKTPTEYAYQAFAEWCRENGFAVPNSATFGRDLLVAASQIKKSRLRMSDGSRTNYYVGMRVLPAEPAIDRMLQVA